MLERFSSNQLVDILTHQIAQGQDKLFRLTNQLSTGKKFSTAYENPIQTAKALVIKGDMAANERRLANSTYALLELDSAESALGSMGDIVRKAREIVIAARNDSNGLNERKLHAQEVRQLGELMISVANTKAAGKYIFSGVQANVPTLKLASGASFSSAVYRGGEGDLGERSYDGNQSSLSLRTLFSSSASSAQVTGSIVNPSISSDGDLSFTVNDGADRITTVNVSLSAGDDLSDVISKINTEFVVSGGLGQIVRNSPTGFLNFATDLAIGDVTGETASITINNSSDDSILNDLGLKPSVTKGSNTGLLSFFSSLENALNTNDAAAIQDLLDIADYNLNKINNLRGQAGSLSNKVEALESVDDALQDKLEKDRSSIEDVDIAKISQQYTNAQTALQAAIQSTANFFRNSLRGLSGFLGA